MYARLLLLAEALARQDVVLQILQIEVDQTVIEKLLRLQPQHIAHAHGNVVVHLLR